MLATEGRSTVCIIPRGGGAIGGGFNLPIGEAEGGIPAGGRPGLCMLPIPTTPAIGAGRPPGPIGLLPGRGGGPGGFPGGLGLLMEKIQSVSQTHHDDTVFLGIFISRFGKWVPP